MKIKQAEDEVNYYLELSEEEYENLQSFLNRHGLLDRFPKNMPKPIEVFAWMFPESIDSDSLRSTGQSGDGSGGGEEEADEACLARRPLGGSPNIHGGLAENLDPGLRDILKHRKRST